MVRMSRPKMYNPIFSALTNLSDRRLERFCYAGDDRNIRMRYILGNEVEI